jgi:spermidine synthase
MGTETISLPAQTTPSTFLAAISLTSFSALLLELALTRLFSVVLFYHFAFLAISVALLGLGAGGVFAHLWRNWLTRFATRRLAAILCTANAAAIFLALEVVLHVPVSLELSRWNLLRLTALYLASAVPFFFTGLIFSVVFARETRHVTRLYGADLLGGATACLAVVPVLNWIGGPNAILFSALAMAGAAIVWERGSERERSDAQDSLGRASRPSGLPAGRRRYGREALSLRILPWIAGAALLVLIIANHSGRLLDVIYAKGELRDRSWVEFAKWNAISRVEVDRQSQGKVVVIDADASTYIMNADLRHWQGSEWEKDLMSAPPALANVLRPRGDYAIIGPGGGVDVLRALASGSTNVTGIEINPIIADTVMRQRYADYSYHLYQRPEVHMQVTDGRSFIRNSRAQYDVVQMTLVDTWASTAAGAFALSENSLYTADAFREYFQHLKPDGMIAITRWEFRRPREALRVVSVAMEALHQLGVRNPARHFIVVSEGELDADGIPVVVLAKKSPFSAGEEAAVIGHLEKYEDLQPLYLPSAPGSNPFSALIAGNDPWAFARSYAYNVAPVNDNAPFFFFTLKTAQILREEGLQHGIDWKVNLGVVVLGMVLLISLAAVLAFLILPMVFADSGPSRRWISLLYFVVVGLGYILVEIAFIQRFVLFLGHPTYALTVVIFLLLLSSGGGSLISRRWLPEPARVWLPLLLLAAAIGVYVVVLPAVLSALVGFPFALKLVISGLILIPLGGAMGMPFPTGLRALASSPVPEFPSNDGNAVEWAWAMNAASSVLGSVLAMVIAIHWGLNVTLAGGAAAYLAAALLSRTLLPTRA